jgi:hypothetical protein
LDKIEKNVGMMFAAIPGASFGYRDADSISDFAIHLLIHVEQRSGVFLASIPKTLGNV